jgi:hypothetical protein
MAVRDMGCERAENLCRPPAARFLRLGMEPTRAIST